MQTFWTHFSTINQKAFELSLSAYFTKGQFTLICFMLFKLTCSVLRVGKWSVLQFIFVLLTQVTQSQNLTPTCYFIIYNLIYICLQMLSCGLLPLFSVQLLHRTCYFSIYLVLSSPHISSDSSCDILLLQQTDQLPGFSKVHVGLHHQLSSQHLQHFTTHQNLTLMYFLLSKSFSI